MFDELFPRSSLHFDVSALSSVEWLDGLENGRAEILWSIAVLSDELVRTCASFHGEGDLFVSYRFSSRWANLRREIAMAARRKKTDGIRQEDKAEWKGFLDFRLDDALLAELDEWKPRPADVWAEVDAAIAAGFRYTLSYNARTHLASCTMICDDSNKPYGGYALSCSDDDGSLSLKMMVFKHLKLGHDWSTLLSDDKPKGRRG
jgi:hypothetical protein